MKALEQAKVDYLGSHGKFTALLKSLGNLPKEERPAAGKLINVAKVELEAALASRREELELKAAMPKQATDFTLPGRRTVGKLHPLTQVTEDIVRAFQKIGFVVADGPEVEDEWHCFDALNTPADHPARDTQDTFYIQGFRGASSVGPLQQQNVNFSARILPPVQIRVMEKQPPPIRIIAPGRLSPRQRGRDAQPLTFQQIEGLYVDKGVTVGDLKAPLSSSSKNCSATK